MPTVPLALPASPSSFNALTPPGCNNSPTMRSGSAKSRSKVTKSKRNNTVSSSIQTRISLFRNGDSISIRPLFLFSPLLPDQPSSSTKMWPDAKIDPAAQHTKIKNTNKNQAICPCFCCPIRWSMCCFGCTCM